MKLQLLRVPNVSISMLRNKAVTPESTVERLTCEDQAAKHASKEGTIYAATCRPPREHKANDRARASSHANLLKIAML